MNQTIPTNYGISHNTLLPSAERYEMVQAETRVSTTTISPSRQLVCPVAGNQLVVWQAILYLGGNSPGDYKIQWVTPSSPVSGGMLSIAGGANPISYGLTTGYNTNIHLTGAAGAVDVYMVLFYGWLLNANGGEFGLQWAQNASNATLSSLPVGCYMEVWRR